MLYMIFKLVNKILINVSYVKIRNSTTNENFFTEDYEKVTLICKYKNNN